MTIHRRDNSICYHALDLLLLLLTLLFTTRSSVDLLRAVPHGAHPPTSVVSDH